MIFIRITKVQAAHEMSQKLMTLFFEKYLQTQNKQQAFKEAQLEIRTQYPEAKYWGLFCDGRGIIDLGNISNYWLNLGVFWDVLLLWKSKRFDI
jgi:hypothetical protein